MHASFCLHVSREDAYSCSVLVKDHCSFCSEIIADSADDVKAGCSSEFHATMQSSDNTRTTDSRKSVNVEAATNLSV